MRGPALKIELSGVRRRLCGKMRKLAIKLSIEMEGKILEPKEPHFRIQGVKIHTPRSLLVFPILGTQPKIEKLAIDLMKG